MSDKIIHFGEFIRWHRVNAGKTTETFGREIGLTARRLIAIEAMPEANVQHTTMVALARALHIEPEEFDRAWRSTPVRVTRRKPGPTTDEAQRFTIACRRNRVSPAEGMRRLRSWLVEQPQPVQDAALGFENGVRRSGGMFSNSETSPEAATFTDAVDHLQDPAQATRRRVASHRSKAEKSAEPDSTSSDKRR